MINITRTPTPPASLTTPEIRQYIVDVQQYLLDLQAHKDDPVANPVKPTPPEKPVAYRNRDLLEAFDRDFYAKCYLTELWFPNSWAMDVEHFHPQSERPDLVYEWTNLFPADHQANTIKPRKTFPGGYLNPCEPAEDVEREIMYRYAPSMGEFPAFEAKDPQNIKAANTAALLHRVHNGHDFNTKQSTATLRYYIRKQYELISKVIDKWQKAPADSPEKEDHAQELRGFLSRRSSFTMLMRSIPAVQVNIPADFLD